MMLKKLTSLCLAVVFSLILTQPVQAAEQFTIGNSPLGTEYSSSTYTENDWTEFTTTANYSPVQARIQMDVITDGYPEELVIYLQSPNGTTKNILNSEAALEGSTTNSLDITKNFGEDVTTGVWKFWLEDTASDGGNRVENVVITISEGVKPIITSVSPNYGSPSGGTDITLNGSNFSNTPVEKFLLNPDGRSSNYDYLKYGITTDAQNNILVTGSYISATLTIGDQTLTNTDEGDGDIFTAKFNATGNLLWLKGATGTTGQSTGDNDYGRDVVTDSQGNVYVAGHFHSQSLTFGEITINNHYTQDESWGMTDVFLVKYDADGNVVWARSGYGTTGALGDTGYLEVFGLTIDGNDNLYLAGNNDADSVTFGTETVTNSAGENIFVVKYDSSGNVGWLKKVGGNDIDSVSDIAADSQGNVYLTGSFNSTTFTIDESSVSNSTDVSAADLFVAKLDTAGAVQWIQTAQGESSDIARAIAVDTQGNVFVSGYFYSPTMTWGSTPLTLNSTSDTFLTKLNSSGSLQWIKGTSSDDSDAARSIALDKLGNVYIVGEYVGTYLTLDTVTVNRAALNTDVYVAKYSTAGDILWAKNGTGNDKDLLYDISLDTNNNAYILGISESTTITFGDTTTTLTQWSSPFILKYQQTPTVLLGATTCTNPTFVSSSQLTCVTPAGEGVVEARVTNPSGAYGIKTNGYSFSDTPPADEGGGDNGGDDGGDAGGDDNGGGEGNNETQPTSTSSQSSTSSGSSSAPVCTDAKPGSRPDLFQIDTTASQAKLFYAPGSGNISNYYIAYSETLNQFIHGTETGQRESTGVLSYTVNYLQPNTTYYFQVRAQNGCMPGDWSQVLQVKTARSGKQTTASYYKNTQSIEQSKSGSSVATTKKKVSSNSVPTPSMTPAPEPVKTEQNTPPQPLTTTTPAPQNQNQKCFLWWCW